jgi:hypothetical protein
VDSEILLPQPSVPGGGAVFNPFVIVDDAAGLVDFVSGVFGVAENAQVRTQGSTSRTADRAQIFLICAAAGGACKHDCH